MVYISRAKLDFVAVQSWQNEDKMIKTKDQEEEMEEGTSVRCQITTSIQAVIEM